MKHVGDIAVIVLCAIAIGLGGAIVIAFAPDAPESAPEAPESVQAVETDDEMVERLRRVEALLGAVEAYLAERDDPHAP